MLGRKDMMSLAHVLFTRAASRSTVGGEIASSKRFEEGFYDCSHR